MCKEHFIVALPVRCYEEQMIVLSAHESKLRAPHYWSLKLKYHTTMGHDVLINFVYISLLIAWVVKLLCFHDHALEAYIMMWSISSVIELSIQNKNSSAHLVTKLSGGIIWLLSKVIYLLVIVLGHISYLSIYEGLIMLSSISWEVTRSNLILHLLFIHWIISCLATVLYTKITYQQYFNIFSIKFVHFILLHILF